jgi:alcohol dehydrogenase (cytochrome c)
MGICGGLALAAAAAWLWPGGIAAQSPRAAMGFTTEQAERGETAYAEHCASCHGQNLDDGAFAPPLAGMAFRQKWDTQPPETLVTQTRTMPPARPGSLSDQIYADLTAFILRQNGVRAGAQSVPADLAALRLLAPPAWPRGGGGGLAPGADIPAAPARANPLQKIRPVTDAMLTNVADGEWLTWRRTYDAYGFSPLRKINRTNVGDLRLAWSWSLPAGQNATTPIVHDGVLFVVGWGDKVQALDAATGDLLWQYSRRLPTGVPPSHKRSLSIYGSRLYVPTSDVHIVALDVKTGRVVWDQAVGDPKTGVRLTGGTLVARGKVMVGTTGRIEGGNYIVALDTETGKEAWRFYAIARPDEKGGNSWNALPLDKRNGGSVWIPGSYDPVRNLAFFAPGNTYDTGPLRDLVQQDGINNDALYLDSTLALNPDTGQLAWYFQHQANGQWDLDYAFERQVMQLRVNGAVRDVVVTGGKQMIFDILEVKSGQYLSSIDLGLQNSIMSIDPKTGAKRVSQELIPGDGQTKMVCPHVSGGRGWLPTAYDAATRILYIPITEACMDLVPVPAGERGSLSTGVRWTVRPRPASDGKYGRIHAVNLETGKTVWVDRQRAPITAGTLVTAGGLVFAGSLDRMFRAHDATTGATLWSARLNDAPSAPPIAYAANNQEYVAVIVGPGGYQSLSYSALVPEIQNPADRHAMLWVFEVPTRGAAAPTSAAR